MLLMNGNIFLGKLGASSLPSESSHTLQKEKWVKWVRLFSSCGHTKDLWVKLVFDCFPGQTPQAGLLRRDCWVAQDEDCPNFCPYAFKDNHGIALMAYVSEGQAQTPFYHMFSEAVKTAGLSRKDYVYDFQFKAFHFYLTKALQLLRRPCEDSYKTVVYSISQNVSFTFGGLNQARFGHFVLAHSARPQAANDQHILLTIHTCFGVAIEQFFDKESERIILIPLNEIFNVSQDGASNNLILQSTNKTCSHYECAFLGGKCLCSVCACLGGKEWDS